MKKWTQYIGKFGYFSRYGITVSFYSINKTNTKHWYNIRILLTFLLVEYSLNYCTIKIIFVHLDREQLSKINGKMIFPRQLSEISTGKNNQFRKSVLSCCVHIYIQSSITSLYDKSPRRSAKGRARVSRLLSNQRDKLAAVTAPTRANASGFRHIEQASPLHASKLSLIFSTIPDIGFKLRDKLFINNCCL